MANKTIEKVQIEVSQKKKGENGRKEETEQLEICAANKTIEKVQIEVSRKKKERRKREEGGDAHQKRIDPSMRKGRIGG